MNPPGQRLRSWADRACSAQTMERLIDPIVADLQAECEQASSGGHAWRSRWIRVVSYGTCLKAIVLHACQRCTLVLCEGDGSAAGSRPVVEGVTRMIWLARFGIATVIFALWLFDFAALDDITTGNEPYLYEEYVMLGLSLPVLGACWWGLSRLRAAA
jgi:hypothetical protein